MRECSKKRTRIRQGENEDHVEERVLQERQRQSRMSRVGNQTTDSIERAADG
jgi:hypothetical protein